MKQPITEQDRDAEEPTKERETEHFKSDKNYKHGYKNCIKTICTIILTVFYVY